jgi:hypothetical protein
MYPSLALNSWSSCPSLPNAGITAVSHHAQLFIYFQQKAIQYEEHGTYKSSVRARELGCKPCLLEWLSEQYYRASPLGEMLFLPPLVRSCWIWKLLLQFLLLELHHLIWHPGPGAITKLSHPGTNYHSYSSRIRNQKPDHLKSYYAPVTSALMKRTYWVLLPNTLEASQNPWVLPCSCQNQHPVPPQPCLSTEAMERHRSMGTPSCLPSEFDAFL